jgi:hypothetical protein
MTCTCYEPPSEAELEARKPHRPFCAICQDVVRVDIDVPCEVWRAALHRQHWNTYVCAGCFAKQADERGVDWAEHAKFRGWSRLAEDRHVRRAAELENATHAHVAVVEAAQEVASFWRRSQQPTGPVIQRLLEAAESITAAEDATQQGLLEPHE